MSWLLLATPWLAVTGVFLSVVPCCQRSLDLHSALSLALKIVFMALSYATLIKVTPLLAKVCSRLRHFTIREGLLLGEEGVWAVVGACFEVRGRLGKAEGLGFLTLPRRGKLIVASKGGKVLLIVVSRSLLRSIAVERLRESLEEILLAARGRLRLVPANQVFKAKFRESVNPLNADRYSLLSGRAVAVAVSLARSDEVLASMYVECRNDEGCELPFIKPTRKTPPDLAINIIESLLRTVQSPPLGGVEIGTSRWGERVKLPLKGHAAILGMSGSGKTSLLMLLAKKIAERELVLVIDFAGQLAMALRSEGKLLVPGVNLGLRLLEDRQLEEVVEVLETASLLAFGEEGRFSPLVYDILLRAVEGALASGGRRLEDVVRQLKIIRATAARREEVLGADATLRRIAPLISAGVEDGGEFSFDEKLVVADLSGIPKLAQSLFANMLIEEVWRRKHPAYILIDEAHRLARRLRRGEALSDVLEEVLREGRKYGIRIILADQSPTTLAPSALGQCHSIVLMKQIHPEEVRLEARFLEGYYKLEEAEELIRSLKPGEAVLIHEGGIVQLLVDKVKLPPPPRRSLNAWTGAALEYIADRWGIAPTKLARIVRYVTPEDVAKALSGSPTSKLKDLGLISQGGKLTRLGFALADYYSLLTIKNEEG